ncbi:hypothetical protein E1A91_D13G232700v1 [Gossypium mustelinum]|uniref:Uncharacterized protein n=1 Tax=Gossypium mustelinum TaxID=34275 RepID=A0A5D2S960_GOSMU|nr:hypothetical protein E1A91_D13G232700v1 [Gossypium mustelinum]
MAKFASKVAFKRNEYKYRSEQNDDRRDKLSDVFRTYAANGLLNKEKLKDGFLHLGSAMPHLQANEALRVVGKTDHINVMDETELNALIDYAYNKGYGYSI